MPCKGNPTGARALGRVLFAREPNRVFDCEPEMARRLPCKGNPTGAWVRSVSGPRLACKASPTLHSGIVRGWGLD